MAFLCILYSMENGIILLTGFMAAGKTTIGKRMATEKSYSFIDLDDYIESKVHKSISDIFEEFGEEYFRKLETEAFISLLEKYKTKLVIASGGGFPLSLRNRKLMKKVHTIFINTPLEVIKNRLNSLEIAKRPMLANNIGALEKLYEERLPIYLETADSILFA